MPQQREQTLARRREQDRARRARVRAAEQMDQGLTRQLRTNGKKKERPNYQPYFMYLL